MLVITKCVKEVKPLRLLSFYYQSQAVQLVEIKSNYCSLISHIAFQARQSSSYYKSFNEYTSQHPSTPDLVAVQLNLFSASYCPKVNTFLSTGGRQQYSPYVTLSNQAATGHASILLQTEQCCLQETYRNYAKSKDRGKGM